MADTTHTIRIRMDTSDVRQGTQETQTALRQVESQADRATQRVGLMGRAFANLRTQVVSMTGALAGFSAGFAALASIRVLSDFDDQMASVRAVTLATDADFKTLRDTALELGSSTRFTATQAAEGLELLARAGLDAKGSIQAIIPTLQTAQAENLTLAETADYLAKITQGMRLPLSEVGRVADVLAATASATATDVRQLGTAMKYAAPIAAGFKISVEETAAALGVLANSGLTADQGGTAFRGILSRIAAPTKEFKQDLKSIGLTVEELDPKINGMVGILDKLSKAGITTSQSFELFKQRAGAGTEILVDGADKVKELLKQLNGVRGTLDKKFEIKADTLASDLRSVLSGVQALILALGDAGLTRVIRTLAQVFAAAFRGLAEAITTLVPYVVNIGIAFATVFSPVILAAFIGGIVRLIPLFAALTVQILGAAAAMALLALANPFTAIAAVIGIVITLIQQFGDRFRVIGTDFANLQDLLQAVTNKIAQGFAVISKAAGEAFQAVTNYAATAANFLSTAFSEAINFVVGKLNALLKFENDVSNAIRRLVGSPEIAGAQFGNFDFNIKPPSIVSDVLRDADSIALARQENEMVTALNDGLTKLGATKKQVAAATKTEAEEEKNLREQHSRQRDVLNDIFGAQLDALANIATLNRLFGEGKVTVSEYADQLQRLRGQLLASDQTLQGGILKGLNQVAEGATKLGDRIGQSISSAFDSASSAIADFAATGKFSFQDLANSILRDMTRLAANAVFGSLMNGLLGSIGGGAVGGAGALGGGFNLGSLFGFATGGSFEVGGSGGTDSKLIAFRATPGELVNVQRPGQSGNGGGTIVNVINNGDGTVRQEQRRDARGNTVVDVIVEQKVNQLIASGRTDRAFEGRFGFTNLTKKR